MMKHLIALLLLGISASLAFAADDVAVQRYVNAHITMLQAQVTQLNFSVNLLNTESLSDQDKFERIGEPAFVAIDNALAGAGYTVQTFYQFDAENNDAITTWLINNSVEANLIKSLKIERDGLMGDYEQRMNTPKAGN